MLNLRSLEEITKSIRADVSALLASLDPTIFGSFIRTITDSNAGRHFDNTQTIGQLEKELFPQTAEGEPLERWAQYEGITRFTATASSGPVTATGLTGNTIPAGTTLRAETGNLYTTEADAIIATIITSITSLNRSGTTVTAVTTSAHGLATNVDVLIAGAVETDYNGTFTITVIDETTFTYEITGTPTTPATGTITVSCDCATVNIESDGIGTVQNLDSGALLTLTTPISGVDAVAYAQATGIIGAQDEESDESLLVRTLQSRTNPVANFNVAAITKEALSIQGVTRVLVKRITPLVGQVTVLFVRDNDDNIIPDGAEVAEVRAAIIDILPATSAEADVFVLAPTPVSTNYNFSAISPDTPTMRTAIEENIKAFYEDEVTFETDITEDKYRSAIIDTIDPETGNTLISFTLTTPSGNITVTTNEIGVPGDITF